MILLPVMKLLLQTVLILLSFTLYRLNVKLSGLSMVHVMDCTNLYGSKVFYRNLWRYQPRALVQCLMSFKTTSVDN
jgi:hypothetical protein